MKNNIKFKIATILSICLIGFFAATASAQEYEALKGVESVKTIFDFRDGDTQNALIHIQLVHDTYKDKAIQGISEKPDFVVVFMDVSVLLLSKNRENFSSKEKSRLAEMDKTISAMANDGIRLEVCMVAVNLLGVNPESITPEIHRVGNGWIASLGYQQKGYSLVPAY